MIALTAKIMFMTKNQPMMHRVATFRARQCHGKGNNNEKAAMKAIGANSGCIQKEVKRIVARDFGAGIWRMPLYSSSHSDNGRNSELGTMVTHCDYCDVVTDWFPTRHTHDSARVRVHGTGGPKFTDLVEAVGRKSKQSTNRGWCRPNSSWFLLKEQHETWKWARRTLLPTMKNWDVDPAILTRIATVTLLRPAQLCSRAAVVIAYGQQWQPSE